MAQPITIHSSVRAHGAHACGATRQSRPITLIRDAAQRHVEKATRYRYEKKRQKPDGRLGWHSVEIPHGVRSLFGEMLVAVPPSPSQPYNSLPINRLNLLTGTRSLKSPSPSGLPSAIELLTLASLSARSSIVISVGDR